MSIEERMSESILYNLNILCHAVKPNNQLKEYLTEGLFIKPSTNAFIHVTFYLFNVLDPKEFKRKFYWPIIDKKTENSYRSNSVEFINMVIDRYNINQDKIKQVTVVHPSGKKFMSLMLDLIGISIKQVMKRKKIDPGVSLNIEKAEELVGSICEVEDNVINNVNAEIKLIKDKTAEIQTIIDAIYPQDENSVSFKEFIENWHLLNKKRLENLKARSVKVEKIFTTTNLLQEKAQKMLNNKKYEIIQPSPDDIKEVTEFYHHIELPADKELNIFSLLLYLQSTLSIIQNYIKNFSYDEVEISQEEINIVKRELIELQHFEPLIKKLTTRENELKEKIAKLRLEKEEREVLMEEVNRTLSDENEKSESLNIESLRSPTYSFDTSRNCMNSINLRKNRLIFAMDNDGTSIADHTAILNQSKLYPSSSESRLNKTRDMHPPKQPQSKQPPSRRRRRDPMQLMEQAISSTSNRNKFDLNATAASYNGAIPKYSSTPFSSTMLSPDLIHHANPNFSMISTGFLETPLSAFPSAKIPEPHTLFRKPSPVIDEEPTGAIIEDNAITFRKPLDILGDNVKNVNKYSSTLPKILLSNETSSLPNNNTFGSSFSENDTICKKENFGSNVEIDTMLLVRKPYDEDLFNISDSILVDDE